MINVRLVIFWIMFIPVGLLIIITGSLGVFVNALVELVDKATYEFERWCFGDIGGK